VNIAENICDRKAAEMLHQIIGELLADEVAKLPSDQSRQMFFRMLFESAQKNLPQSKLQQKRNAGKGKKKPTSLHEMPGWMWDDDDIQEAIEINDEIQSLADQIEWPDAPDVAETSADIVRTVEERRCVTVGQLEALRNMLDGMRAWIRDWD